MIFRITALALVGIAAGLIITGAPLTALFTLAVSLIAEYLHRHPEA